MSIFSTWSTALFIWRPDRVGYRKKTGRLDQIVSVSLQSNNAFSWVHLSILVTLRSKINCHIGKKILPSYTRFLLCTFKMWHFINSLRISFTNADNSFWYQAILLFLKYKYKLIDTILPLLDIISVYWATFFCYNSNNYTIQWFSFCLMNLWHWWGRNEANYKGVAYLKYANN